jgi:hypothetical protein
LKYFAESTFTDEMGFFIEDVVIAEFFHTLVDVSFILFDLDCLDYLPLLWRGKT